MSAAHEHGSADCREIFARLSEYLDGELDPGLCSGLEEHMGDCPPCQAFLQSLQRTVELTRGLPAQDLPEELRRELLQNYRRMREAGED